MIILTAGHTGPNSGAQCAHCFEPLRLAGTLTSSSSSLQDIMQINLPSVLAAFVGSPINRGGVFWIVLSITLPLFIGGVRKAGGG